MEKDTDADKEQEGGGEQTKGYGTTCYRINTYLKILHKGHKNNQGAYRTRTRANKAAMEPHMSADTAAASMGKQPNPAGARGTNWPTTG